MSSKGSNPKKKAPRRARYTAETKAAVLAALLTGQGIDQVAREYKLPEGTVKGWKSKMKSGETPRTTPVQRADMGDLLLEYLKESLTTLKIQQATLFRDSSWLAKQGAAEMGTLHGIGVDKVARLMELLSGDSPPESLT